MPRMPAPDQRLGHSLQNGESPALSKALLETLLEQGSIPTERRIFVNRTLRLESIGYVGFDLDWTLADYERAPLEQLTFDLTVERLIEHHGYPRLILQAELRPNFPRRGLLIDKQAGTVLRMNRHRYVNRAYLGRQRLDRGQLKKLYRWEPIQPSSDRFYHLDTLFELPEANLYAELIELGRRHPEAGIPSSWKIFDDVRTAIDWVHAHGPLKSRVMAEIGRYLKRDAELGLALLRLALGGRRLILLTNSEWDYACAICSYLFDDLLPGLTDWRQLFDLILVGSRKPEFFRSKQDFFELDPDGQARHTTRVPNWGGIYQRGCLEGLMRLIDEPGERVLYVGDHIYGDIVSSKLESTWRTTLIVRELEEEIVQRRQLGEQIERGRVLKERLIELGHEMDHLRDILLLYSGLADTDLGAAQSRIEDIQRRYRSVTVEHRRVLREQAAWAEQTANRFNPFWGSFFKQGTSKTRFSGQLETYACLYTSRVSNFVAYGSHRYFRVTRDPMMHELTDPEDNG